MITRQEVALAFEGQTEAALNGWTYGLTRSVFDGQFEARFMPGSPIEELVGVHPVREALFGDIAFHAYRKEQERNSAEPVTPAELTDRIIRDLTSLNEQALGPATKAAALAIVQTILGGPVVGQEARDIVAPAFKEVLDQITTAVSVVHQMTEPEERPNGHLVQVIDLEPQYPEHAKMGTIHDEAQAIGDFLTWLGAEGMVVAEWYKPETNNIAELVRIQLGTEALLAKYFQIDLNRLNREKDQVLTAIRSNLEDNPPTGVFDRNGQWDPNLVVCDNGCGTVDYKNSMVKVPGGWYCPACARGEE